MTTPDWTTLRNGISGSIILPGQPGYSGYSGGWNTRTGLRKNPIAVTLPVSENDISVIMRFCYERGLTLIPRSGGHSFIGTSNTNGVLMDLRGYTGVSLINENKIIAKSGTQMGWLYYDLYTQGYSFAGYSLALPPVQGSNMNVGVGMALGGGHGLMTSKYQTLNERITAARVVLYDGSVVTCDNYENPDLFWALKGGGGGAFGIVSELTFKPHRFERLKAISVEFNVNNIHAGLSAWQTFCKNVGNTVYGQASLIWPGSMAELQTYANGGLGITLNARLAAPIPISNNTLFDLATSYGLFPTGASYSFQYYEPFAPFTPPTGPFAPAYENIYNFGLMPKNNFGITETNVIIKKTREFCQGILGTGPYPGLSGPFPVGFGASFLLLVGYGGNLRDNKTNSSSFPHKDALHSCQFLMSWTEANKAREPIFIQYMKDFFTEITGVSGTDNYYGYCNYPIELLGPTGPTGYGRFYWGKNLYPLQQVKKAYDPNNFINSPHSVPPLDV